MSGANDVCCRAARPARGAAPGSVACSCSAVADTLHSPIDVADAMGRRGHVALSPSYGVETIECLVSAHRSTDVQREPRCERGSCVAADSSHSTSPREDACVRDGGAAPPGATLLLDV
jgi:hypothetical protein